MRIQFRFEDQGIQEFEVAKTASNQPSSFLIGVQKGGSTLMHQVVKDVAPFSEKALFEAPTEVFRRGLGMYKLCEDVDKLFLKRGYIFATFRWLPQNDIFRLTNWHRHAGPKLLLVRDPRDMLVSLYYSALKSHVIPKEGPLQKSMTQAREAVSAMELDEFVLARAPAVLRDYFRTLQVTTFKEVEVLRYCDVVFDKETLVRRVAETCEAHVPDDDIKAIAKKHDIRPTEERVDQHVRQVTPGNFAKKLKPETIEVLNASLDPILRKFNFGSP